jgi:predicted nucleic acid-binding protein
VNVLLDTNILGRLVEVGHPHHPVASDATDALRKRGDVPCLVPQVLYEFWVVATRAVSANGLGLSTSETLSELARLKTLFPLLPDTPAVYPEWERLVTAHQVIGKHAHDARLVAVMTVHALSQILTFNVGDFARYPGITALDPASVVPRRP